MRCITKEKPGVGSKRSVDASTKGKPKNDQSLGADQNTQSKASPLENQPDSASSSRSDDECAPVLPPTVLNEEASVSDSRIAHSEDDRPRAPTDPNQELCHTGQHKGPLAPLVAAIESPQCQHHAGKMLELYCSSHEQPVCLLCAITSHRSCHDIETLDEAVEERSEELEELVKTLKDEEDALAWERKNIENTLKAVHLKHSPVPDKYDQSSSRMHDWMKDKRKTQPRNANVQAIRSDPTNLPLDLLPEKVKEEKNKVNADERSTSMSSTIESSTNQFSYRQLEWANDERTMTPVTTCRPPPAVTSVSLVQAVKSPEDQALTKRQRATDDIQIISSHQPDVFRLISHPDESVEVNAPECYEVSLVQAVKSPEDQALTKRQRATDDIQIISSHQPDVFRLISHPDESVEVNAPECDEGVVSSPPSVSLVQAVKSPEDQALTKRQRAKDDIQIISSHHPDIFKVISHPDESVEVYAPECDEVVVSSSPSVSLVQSVKSPEDQALTKRQRATDDIQIISSHHPDIFRVISHPDQSVEVNAPECDEATTSANDNRFTNGTCNFITVPQLTQLPVDHVQGLTWLFPSRVDFYFANASF
ncbi:hypothetical protein ACOMHN_038545 [Nucella lapillus]